MTRIMGILSFCINIYMMIVFVRIFLTWFSGAGYGGFQNTLARITDPYLNWFRRFSVLRLGFLDLSPVVALGVLSLVNRVFSTLARYGTITLGIILAMILQAVWGAVSFFLGFLIIVLVLRFIAYLTRQNAYNPFWRVIDTISQPVLYRINRVLFKNRIPKYGTSVIISAAALGLCYVLLRILAGAASGMLAGLPI